MEASATTTGAPSTLGRAREWADAHPAAIFLGLLGVVAVLLAISEGLNAFGENTINGLVSGSSIALGAVGLTLVYGILKLTNFAHGDMLTAGAYIALYCNLTLELSFIASLLIAVVVMAALGVFLELTMFAPMRRRKAGMLQLLLMTIGLAFVLRNVVQFFAGTDPEKLDVNITDTYTFLDLSIGQTKLYVGITAIAVLLGIATMLRVTSLGRQMRALSDNFDLAETTGIDTGRIVIWTWVLAAGLAGLAGVLIGAAGGGLTPNFGFQLLLSMFAAVVLGGIGNAYGALIGGLVIGLTQEWSVLILDEAVWKEAVSFGILILVLIVRPQGIFGRARAV